MTGVQPLSGTTLPGHSALTIILYIIGKDCQYALRSESRPFQCHHERQQGSIITAVFLLFNSRGRLLSNDFRFFAFGSE